ncbi:hypothetical protein GJV85_03705 [Sulfurimonas aquatica]|uniref:Integrase n=1 Tax=Sulfurimonas aquatica TaxID=2672570 RepID=A0A975AZ38_9BACT|nr:hypothetical protein [Sulfurimonas aquatica]QSZ41252.1 hypothetical protein GJV85_03705 [Sulfurimonas aquatica]
MPSLKGSSFEKQQRDMNFKLFALGTKKANDNLTHSEALLTKRNMYFKDFSDYLESTGQDGKFNLLLNEENLNGFLEQRLDGLALSTVENYLSGFNSLLSAFKEVNITVGVSENYFKEKFNDIKVSTPINQDTENRGLQSESILEDLKEIRYESFVLGRIMLNNGYRISETMAIAKEPHKYIKPLGNGDYKITGVVGKGGKIYHDKIINHKDRELILNMKSIPSKQSFNRDLKQLDPNLRAHDYRYQFAKNLFHEKVSELGYKGALLEVSKALNHNRESVSLWYLRG